MNKNIEEFAEDLMQIMNNGYKQISKETYKYIKEKHKYSSVEDFEKAHPKTVYEITAETLYKEGYRKVYSGIEQFDNKVESQRKEIERLKTEKQQTLKDYIAELKDQIKAVGTIFSRTNEYAKQTDGLIRTGLDIALRKIDETAELFLGDKK